MDWIKIVGRTRFEVGIGESTSSCSDRRASGGERQSGCVCTRGEYADATLVGPGTAVDGGKEIHTGRRGGHGWSSARRCSAGGHGSERRRA